MSDGKPMEGWTVTALFYELGDVRTSVGLESARPMAEVILERSVMSIPKGKRKPVPMPQRVCQPQFMERDAWDVLAQVYRGAGAKVIEQRRSW